MRASASFLTIADAAGVHHQGHQHPSRLLASSIHGDQLLPNQGRALASFPLPRVLSLSVAQTLSVVFVLQDVTDARARSSLARAFVFDPRRLRPTAGRPKPRLPSPCFLLLLYYLSLNAPSLSFFHRELTPPLSSTRAVVALIRCRPAGSAPSPPRRAFSAARRHCPSSPAVPSPLQPRAPSLHRAAAVQAEDVASTWTPPGFPSAGPAASSSARIRHFLRSSFPSPASTHRRAAPLRPRPRPAPPRPDSFPHRRPTPLSRSAALLHLRSLIWHPRLMPRLPVAD